MSETVLIVLGAIGLLAAGTGLGYWLGALRARDESARADEVRQEFEAYRRDVTQHFGQTAEHFRAIGREYRNLYEHMASGADSLCDRESVDVKLSFAPKAILESIAEERQESKAPRDFAPDERPAADEPVEAAPPVAEKAADKTQKEAQPESETRAAIRAGRTLH
jgi:uncharacterized membrane-anchored protein YhcB (DUF1043 family)